MGGLQVTGREERGVGRRRIWKARAVEAEEFLVFPKVGRRGERADAVQGPWGVGMRPNILCGY